MADPENSQVRIPRGFAKRSRHHLDDIQAAHSYQLHGVKVPKMLVLAAAESQRGFLFPRNQLIQQGSLMPQNFTPKELRWQDPQDAAGVSQRFAEDGTFAGQYSYFPRKHVMQDGEDWQGFRSNEGEFVERIGVRTPFTAIPYDEGWPRQTGPGTALAEGVSAGIYPNQEFYRADNHEQIPESSFQSYCGSGRAVQRTFDGLARKIRGKVNVSEGSDAEPEWRVDRDILYTPRIFAQEVHANGEVLKSGTFISKPSAYDVGKIVWDTLSSGCFEISELQDVFDILVNFSQRFDRHRVFGTLQLRPQHATLGKSVGTQTETITHEIGVATYDNGFLSREYPFRKEIPPYLQVCLTNEKSKNVGEFFSTSTGDPWWYFCDHVPITPDQVRWPDGSPITEEQIPPLLLVDSLPEGYIRGLQAEHYAWRVRQAANGDHIRALERVCMPMCVKGVHILWRHSHWSDPRSPNENDHTQLSENDEPMRWVPVAIGEDAPPGWEMGTANRVVRLDAFGQERFNRHAILNDARQFPAVPLLPVADNPPATSHRNDGLIRGVIMKREPFTIS